MVCSVVTLAVLAGAPSVAPAQGTSPSTAARDAVRARLSPALRARLKQPVKDAALRDLLVAGAKAYRVGSSPLPLTIDPNTIIDLGVVSKKGSVVQVGVDLAASPALTKALRQSSGIDPSKVQVSARLTAYLAPSSSGAGVEYGQSLFVSTVGSGRVAVWRVRNGKWTKTQDTALSASTNQLFSTKVAAVGTTFGGYAPLVATPDDRKLIQMIASDGESSNAQLMALVAALQGQAPATPPAGVPTYASHGGPAFGCEHYCSSTNCGQCCGNGYNAAIQQVWADTAACSQTASGSSSAMDECLAAHAALSGKYEALLYVCKKDCGSSHPEAGANPQGCAMKK